MLNYSKYIRKKTVLTTIGEATTKKIVPWYVYGGKVFQVIFKERHVINKYLLNS